MNPKSARFHELLKELGDLHDKKQSDYGNDHDPFSNLRDSLGFGVAPSIGALIRLNDKVNRLKSFAIKGSLANESAEDSLRDIAVYAIIALVLLEEEQEHDCIKALMKVEGPSRTLSDSSGREATQESIGGHGPGY